MHFFLGIIFHSLCYNYNIKVNMFVNKRVSKQNENITFRINEVIVSQNKESILNCLKGVVSNSSLTESFNCCRHCEKRGDAEIYIIRIFEHGFI